MNLAQAHLAGVISGEVQCLVLEYGGERGSFGSRVLAGTIRIVGQMVPEISVRHVMLRPSLANARIARLVRSAKIKDEGTVLLGVYPSPLWARSEALERAGRIILLDDGASSLSLDLSRIFEGKLVLRASRVFARLLEGVAGPVRQVSSPVFAYSCFPVEADRVSVLSHRYSELCSAARKSAALSGVQLPGRRIWADSNYAWLSPKSHMALLRAAATKFGIDAYVPHRRTGKEFTCAVNRELGLRSVRPEFPIELMIGAWTNQGAHIVTPPTSLVHTASMFRQPPGEIVVAKTSRWLRQHAVGVPSGEADGLERAIKHAALVEGSLDASEVDSIVSLG